jgi:hypothetical protein
LNSFVNALAYPGPWSYRTFVRSGVSKKPREVHSGRTVYFSRAGHSPAGCILNSYPTNLRRVFGVINANVD